MSGLRRDLIERRLWIVVVLLVAAVIAVPFLLGGDADATAGAALAPPPAVAGTSTTPVAGEPSSQHPTGSSTVPASVQQAETTRDPFEAVAGSSGSSSDTSTGTTTTPSSSGAASTSSGGSTTAPASDPVTSDPASTPTTTAAAPSSGPTTVTVTTTTPASPPSTTTVPASTLDPPGGPWTVYAVDVRIGVPGHLASHTDLPRLTPLPSVAAPKAMFTGVLDHGRLAMFALGTGVRAVGPGRCSPTPAVCSEIALARGQTEELSWFATDGSGVGEQLSVSRIAADSTRSRATALTAFARHSQAGQCELDLMSPVQYDDTSGALSPVADAACRHIRHAVPFPGALTGS